MLFNICYLLIYLLANTVALLRSMSICMLQQGGTAKALHLNEQLLTLGMVCMLIHSNNQSICTVSLTRCNAARSLRRRRNFSSRFTGSRHLRQWTVQFCSSSSGGV